MAVFDGSAGNDQYFGTPEADEISGNDGPDQPAGHQRERHPSRLKSGRFTQ